MSHDISLNCAHCGSCLLDRNVTSNLTTMLDKAGIRLADERWVDKPGINMLPTLQAAINRMVADPEDFRKYNPPNGWGEYDGAVEALTALRDAICLNPDAVYADWH
jgi:hypothetical protein